jgi:hypothetical protein
MGNPKHREAQNHSDSGAANAAPEFRQHSSVPAVHTGGFFGTIVASTSRIDLRRLIRSSA